MSYALEYFYFMIFSCGLVIQNNHRNSGIDKRGGGGGGGGAGGNTGKEAKNHVISEGPCQSKDHNFPADK